MYILSFLWVMKGEHVHRNTFCVALSFEIKSFQFNSKTEDWVPWWVLLQTVFCMEEKCHWQLLETSMTHPDRYSSMKLHPQEVAVINTQAVN